MSLYAMVVVVAIVVFLVLYFTHPRNSRLTKE